MLIMINTNIRKLKFYINIVIAQSIMNLISLEIFEISNWKTGYEGILFHHIRLFYLHIAMRIKQIKFIFALKLLVGVSPTLNKKNYE